MYQNKRAAFYTLGCKLNFSETSTISRQLKNKGFIITDFDRVADLYVINTCSVTENANKNCRRIIRKAKEKSPNALIIVTGCYAQLKPKEITQIEGVDMVLWALKNSIGCAVFLLFFLFFNMPFSVLLIIFLYTFEIYKVISHLLIS